MKAIRVKKPGGLDQLMLSTQEPGKPGPGEVLVRVHASSLNYHDYLVAVGHLPVEDGRIPLSDGAGEVLEVGEGVTEFSAGDAVVSLFFQNRVDGNPRGFDHAFSSGDGVDGFACQLACVPATAVTKAPKNLNAQQAATLPCAGLTAWRALMVNGPVEPGQTVLVQGTGGVSLFALQFAKAAGARVIATSSSEEKLERLRALGVDAVINYREHPEWSRKVKALNDGRGVDHVVEVGGAGTLEQSIHACEDGGHIAMIGVLAGFTGQVPTHAIMAKQLRVQGVIVGNRVQQQAMIRAIETHNIQPVLDKTFPLEALAEAFRYQESGRHFGKILVDAG